MSSIADPLLWGVTVAAVVALLGVDFALTRRPHEVTTREAAGWSAFYVALPLAFGGWIWAQFGSDRGVEYLTGYLVEKSLSADNLFVFMLLLGAFAVPAELRQRVLLYGIVGALLLRAVFIALGAAALEAFSFTFLVFGLVLVATAVKVYRDAGSGHDEPVDVSRMRSVRLLRRFMPVTDDYRGTKLLTRVGGRRAATPLALAVFAVLATDIVFAVDSVPAVYGITNDPYLVFATNAFALLGLRALYFLLAGALERLVHLGYGLAIILGVIGVKLVLHWAHDVWPSVPTIPTLAGLVVIVAVLATVTVTSLRATRGQSRPAGGQDDGSARPPALAHGDTQR
ncbi:MAG TPA: TerC family protein [Kineosporiaceae bacterium]|nr:TerC family protein [Kineosporiaceae bacterium]